MDEEAPPKPPAVKPAFMPAALRVRRQVRRGDSPRCHACGREDARAECYACGHARRAVHPLSSLRSSRHAGDQAGPWEREACGRDGPESGGGKGSWEQWYVRDTVILRMQTFQTSCLTLPVCCRGERSGG